MNDTNKYQRFQDLGYEAFRDLARRDGLSRYEKIGFPDEYRAGKEALIFDDIRRKLPALDTPGRRVLDIGPGCSDLPRMLIEHCERHGHSLVLLDSREMLDLLPDRPFASKLAGRFPDCPALMDEQRGSFDAIIAYSLLHYVFVEGCPFGFLDAALSLLAPGGMLLIGDVPNLSKRRRFFASEAGRRFHREFTGKDEDPQIDFNTLEPGSIDDAVIAGLVLRARGQGFDAYWMAQDPGCPMANRREDILVTRP